MNRSKVLMIYPIQGFSGNYARHSPISLLYASIELVKRNVEVIIFDQRLYPDTWQEKLGDIIDNTVLVAGISVMSGTPIKHSRNMSRFIKSRDRDISVVWGGPHVTFYPETILSDEPSVDYVISGYAIESFDKLVKCISEGKIPEEVHGAGWRCLNGESKHNGGGDKSFEIVDYRDIPYHLIEDYNVYGQFDQKQQIFSMYAAVGCPYQCSFCSSPAQYKSIDGKKWIPIEAKQVVDHVQHVVEEYGADYIYFIDDDSFPKLSHVEAIIDEVRNRGLHKKVKLGFRGARINEIKRMDDAFLTKLVDAGTDIMHVGAESGSDRILKLIRKDCTAEDILECNRKLARHSTMKVGYNFIMGLPTETLEDLKKTRDLMWQLQEEHPNCLIFPPNKFRPLPQTELYDIAKNEWGYEMPNTLQDWSEIEVEGDISQQWYDKKIQRFCDLLLVCSYFIDNKIIKVGQGDSGFMRLAKVANLIYRPFARVRFKYGLSRFLFEYKIYAFFLRFLVRKQLVS